MVLGSTAMWCQGWKPGFCGMAMRKASHSVAHAQWCQCGIGAPPARLHASSMTTLVTFRERLRIDLRDPESLTWADTTLDRHIERALRDLSNAIPREAVAELATTAGSRELDIASLAGLVEVEALEYPAGNFPPEFVRFSRWEDTLTLRPCSPRATTGASITPRFMLSTAMGRRVLRTSRTCSRPVPAPTPCSNAPTPR